MHLAFSPSWRIGECAKLLKSLFVRSLTEAIEPLHIYQTGFKKYRGIFDQIASLQEIIQLHYRKTKEYGYLWFLGIKAA